MSYIVSYSKAHEASRELGRFDTFDEALEAARQAGATGGGERSGCDHIYDVDGHENDDNYAIWIEAPRT